MKKTTKQNLSTALALVFMLLCLVGAIVAFAVSCRDAEKKAYADVSTVTSYTDLFYTTYGFEPTYEFKMPAVPLLVGTGNFYPSGVSSTLTSSPVTMYLNFTVAYSSSLTQLFVGFSNQQFRFAANPFGASGAGVMTVVDGNNAFYVDGAVAPNSSPPQYVINANGATSGKSKGYFTLNLKSPASSYSIFYLVCYCEVFAPRYVFGGITDYSITYSADTFPFTVSNASTTYSTKSSYVELKIRGYGRGYGYFDCCVVRFPCATTAGYNQPVTYITDYGIQVLSEFSSSDSYREGYNYGYQEGKNEGYMQGQNTGYTDGYSAGRTEGYDSGVIAGAASANEYTFLGLIGAVIDAPIKAITDMFDFQILGFNMTTFLLSLLTLCVVVKVASMIQGGG